MKGKVTFCHIERSRDISHYCLDDRKRFLDCARNDRLLDRHLLRKSRTHLRSTDKGDADGDQKKREELTAGEAGNQHRVRLAKIFDDDSENRVANEKESGQNAVWLPRARAHEPQNGEQDDPFEKGLIKLRWMARCQNGTQGRRHL